MFLNLYYYKYFNVTVEQKNWCEEQFTGVIFTNEFSVQLEQHSRICFRKWLQPRKLKSRPKHPLKLHIWGDFLSKSKKSHHVQWHYKCREVKIDI